MNEADGIIQGLNLKPAQEFGKSAEDVYRVDSDEIVNKRGNYIFTVGNVGCGKSTLQNLLIYRLWSSEKILFEYSNSSDGSHVHDYILNYWVQRVKNDELPERTKQGHIQEFNISFSMNGSKKLNINFLEISGEDIKCIVPNQNPETRPELNKDLVKYLESNSINKRFVFVSDSYATSNPEKKKNSDHLDEDVLFHTFVSYLLKSRNGLNLRRVNLLFIAAKWDTVSHNYSSVAEYFKKYFPQTRGIMGSDRVDISYIEFSIGKLAKIKSDNDKVSVQKIESLDPKYVDILIQWIYTTFMGVSLPDLPKIRKNIFDVIKSFFR